VRVQAGNAPPRKALAVGGHSWTHRRACSSFQALCGMAKQHLHMWLFSRGAWVRRSTELGCW
jgi:hypothetical protein